ncbi:AAA family ATPase [Streptomyces heilongjiangensis]|uniref:AAA family ATPase n=1 Tax=Streptomyces heilongjiangensis TaxID=945052 RepID=A0ABW1BEJ1_9ACTN|nr:AAA family ATPase [Streptomyces heilongjiangensis]MDC2951030.1 AAA family ATPase [Streptomyces heilongjiangensis]
MTTDSGSLANRLRVARNKTFVGRSEEVARFRAALDGAQGVGPVLYVHGPGGVGKSTLLRRFEDEACRAGRRIVWVDGHRVTPSPAGFLAETTDVVAGPDVVLLIDGFERCQGLEGWLRDRFLPGLREDAVVVVAGRRPPSDEWLCDLAWSDLLEVLPLESLDRSTAAALLERRGVAPARREAILAFADGHPLALSLAASVTQTGTAAGARWTPGPDMIARLLSALVGELPSRDHRLALETAAHALSTTEALLAAVIGEDRAVEMFAWLRALPFAEYGRQGLFLHELVSEVLDQDFRWRDPDSYERMHVRTGHHLLQRARTAAETEAMTAIRALTYLKRYGPMEPYFKKIDREGDVYEDVLRPRDHEQAVRMTLETEGPHSADIVRFWLQEQPGAFRMYRSAQTGELVAFMLWLRLTDPEVGGSLDPVVAQAWAGVAQQGPLLAGQHVRISRFMIHPGAYGQISSVGHLMQLRICSDWIRSRDLAWSFITTPDAELWGPLMDHLGHEEMFRTPWEHGRTFTTFACDWRVTPLEVWFDRTQPGALAEAPAAPEPAGAPRKPLSRTEFDAAVRQALRDLHRPDALRGSALFSSRLCTRFGWTTRQDPVESLRHTLVSAVDEVQRDARASRQHRALAATYLRRTATTQEAAAARLGLPYSTYRRHLSQGHKRLCDVLWHWELGGGADGYSGAGM